MRSTTLSTASGTKSYATRENLEKALSRLGFANDRKLICRTDDGRWTAIFPASNLTGPDGCGYLGLYAQHGFYTIG